MTPLVSSAAFAGMKTLDASSAPGFDCWRLVRSRHADAGKRGERETRTGRDGTREQARDADARGESILEDWFRMTHHLMLKVAISRVSGGMSA